MLQSLVIQNYALIAELNIHFHHGFSAITGETGAGKSILLGAIGLLLGQRAESRMIKTGASRCIIEAEFDLSGYGMDDFFEEHDLDFDGHTCIIRRELTAAGKSRAFINDTPAQVTQLRKLGERLIDIHSQHQNLLLSQEDFQLSVVDLLAHDEDLRREYVTDFTAFREAKARLQMAREAAQKGRDDEDYLRFQLQQLDELQLSQGRQAEAEQEARQLENAEDIRQTLFQTDALLNGDGATQTGVLQALHEAGRLLNTLTTLLTSADELAERIESCRIELKDIADEVCSQAERIEANPERLQRINDWLSNLYTLMQKHHTANEDELIALREDFRRRLDAVDNSEEHLQALQADMEAALKRVKDTGLQLTDRRRKAALEVERQMQERLVPLGIPNVKFQVAVSPRTEPDATGLDVVDFLFSANKNGQLQPISTVASGGEIARVMLSLKAMISTAVSLPTIIFDEIDTGVSGNIAERMAMMMREMGDGGRQVISITHLPQIAARAAHHYRVYKQDDEQGTSSHIVELTTEQRITELGHMLSGTELTEAALQNAKSLLNP